ncbi:sensor domain-containing protein [Stutzerimonas tarimensis]|uniref:EAL domain-containing protein n=1 Tax=Stutzerimonas tarimensis TaxID=1507735 RepID=A0ABV7T3A9_9GAMM
MNQTSDQLLPSALPEGTGMDGAAQEGATLEAMVAHQAALEARLAMAMARQQELERQNSYYRSIFDTLPNPLWLMDDNRHLDANPAAIATLGYPDRATLLGSPVDAAQGARAQTLERVRRAQAGETQRFEWAHQPADGTERIGEVIFSPLQLDGRRLVLGSWHDVTQRKLAERRLAERERSFREQSQRLQEVIEGTHTGTWEYNLRTDSLVCNERWAWIVGYGPSELAPLSLSTWRRLAHPGDFRRAMHDVHRCYRQEIEHYRVEMRMRHKAGHWVWIVVRGKVVQWRDDQQPLRMAGTIQDATARKVSEEQLKLAASVFTHASEGIMITDASVRIVSVNEAFSRITGYRQEEVLGRTPGLLKSGLHGADFYAEVWKALREKGEWSGEIWNRHREGHLYAELVNISAVCDEQGQVKNYVALFNDITQQKQHQQQLERSAHYDPLTDLPNRLLLADRLQQAMVRSHRHCDKVAVAYIDLDGFKAVNDRHGHAVGDRLLVILANRMKSLLREGDTLARLGGDEFAVVIVDMVRQHDCVPVLERLLQALADPVAVAGEVLHVSASIGVTLYPLDDVEADQLLRHADQAMYIAKQTGKNRYHIFDIKHTRPSNEPNQTLEALHQALARGEFCLHYQPRVNMRSGQLVGAEALIRWQHPEHGLLLPSAFLPAVEHHAVSVTVGQWVIAQALGQISAWQRQGLDIPVSVNLSARHIQNRDFLPSLKTLLDSHPDVPPQRLELEVMEAHALEDIDYAARMMNACRELGVRFALDDFGTGYTSLAYLRRLPADTLKLDQSFVQAMPSAPGDMAVVEAVHGLAKAFHRRLIAEGVETEWQGEMLLAMGCELAQGYAIGRPMPADELSGWASRWQPCESWRAWAGRSLSPRALPVLLATVEHSAWRDEVEAYLLGRHDLLPTQDPSGGRFATWYAKEGREHFDAHPAFVEIGQRHRKVQRLAAALLAECEQGRRGEARSRVEELRRESEALVGCLREFAWLAA